MMTKGLFDMFPNTSSAQWKQQIQVDLNGVDYNQTLIWKTLEGIDVKPFYHPEDCLESTNFHIPSQKWQIAQHIYAKSANSSNVTALDAIERGAESILFSIHDDTVAISQLLNNINIDSIKIIINCKFLANKYVQAIPKDILNRIIVLNDVIHHLSTSGNWYTDLNTDLKAFSDLTEKSQCLCVDLEHYQNAGANMVQQLAYGLAQTCEYLNILDHQLKDQQKKEIKVVFKVAIGGNYFFEISKLRSLRILWNTLAGEFGINQDCTIIASPSKRNKSIYDYNNNMLRTTTECMSAILGGANLICNLPYDAIYHKDNEFGSRIARNQLLVLKHESYFDKVENIVDGNYYVNEITAQLTDKALKLLKEIEHSGGLLTQLKNGIIQKKIKENAHKEQDLFNQGTLILLGTNKQINKEEKAQNNIEIYPFVKHNPIKTLIEPIIEKRLAESLEKQRLENEK